MKTLSIDLETFGKADLTKSGVYKYAYDPSFEILLFAYSADEGEVKVVDLACGESIPEEVLTALTDDNVIKYSFNASFERICLSSYLGCKLGNFLSPKSWRCTKVWSGYLGLPSSLQSVGEVLGLDKQKMSEGKDLIKYFCVPCKKTNANGGRERNLPKDAPEKWELFKKYNKRDVEAEMEIQERLKKYPLPPFLWDEYHLSEEINDRGILIDMDLVKKAIEIDEKSRLELITEMEKLTGLENPNSVQQMKMWLSNNGVETESLDKKAIAELQKDAPKELSRVLTLRSQLAKSSVKKYQAMENAVCSDNRARGMFMFYGANRSGRYSGKIIQLQNLPTNHLTGLAGTREFIKNGEYSAVKEQFEDLPSTLSQLIRTAFIPKENSKFSVADFSAIEARVIAFIAGEKWKSDAFAKGEDIYCSTASRMFNVPVVKNGVNGELRQKGKVAELACIAEGELVLTDAGLVPIEKVTTEMKLWDGENWVSHDGVIYKGIKEVITYEGLTATADHLVWVEGKQRPIQFGIASARGMHLVQTGTGGRAIRLGEGNLSRNKDGCSQKTLVCIDQMHRMLFNAVAAVRQFTKRKVKGLSELFTTEKSSQVAGEENDSGKAAMRKSKHKGIQQLWRPWHSLRICKCDRGGTAHDKRIWSANKRYGDRSYRHQRKLCTWKSSFCFTSDELYQPAKERIVRILTGILAVCKVGCNKKIVGRNDTGRDHTGCRDCCCGEKKELETDIRKTRLYDIRNAGERHRFTVSGHLVHNCGYGGSVGALKAMGALEMGLKEDELSEIVSAWREANPNIVRLWRAVGRASTKAVKEKTTVKTHGLIFTYRNGMLSVILPSGRHIAYVKPRISENRFGSECITYEGIGQTKKWERLETYGPKLTENIVQATARDILCYAMKNLNDSGFEIVMHIHDEAVIEAPKDAKLETVCKIMSKTPPWAEGLVLRADGYECEFYEKQ